MKNVLTCAPLNSILESVTGYDHDVKCNNEFGARWDAALVRGSINGRERRMLGDGVRKRDY
ncbi:hypothetical protein L484_003908 [Morus notabilis]|uniref:Uncharacterized protein n=1 Tax=Morus notabilis TaxID=981085 RepID=W9RW33_9ROSA|nr:hypothetical protein L484_003908 [Morus notabilis]